MKFKQLDFELYIRDLLEEFKSVNDIELISDMMLNIVEGVAQERMDELEEEDA